jgi:hypothetical protein
MKSILIASTLVLILSIAIYFASRNTTIIINNEIKVNAALDDVFDYMTRQQGHKPN